MVATPALIDTRVEVHSELLSIFKADEQHFLNFYDKSIVYQYDPETVDGVRRSTSSRHTKFSSQTC